MRPSNLAFPEFPMAANMRQSAIALPKGWPRRVRSDVIHTIALAQTAARFLVTPLTVSSWTTRLDEEGPNALVRIPEPVNRFPEFVGYLVGVSRSSAPRWGRRACEHPLPREPSSRRDHGPQNVART